MVAAASADVRFCRDGWLRATWELTLLLCCLVTCPPFAGWLARFDRGGPKPAGVVHVNKSSSASPIRKSQSDKAQVAGALRLAVATACVLLLVAGSTVAVRPASPVLGLASTAVLSRAAASRARGAASNVARYPTASALCSTTLMSTQSKDAATAETSGSPVRSRASAASSRQAAQSIEARSLSTAGLLHVRHIATH
jgi:hypothetical protein